MQQRTQTQTIAPGADMGYDSAFAQAYQSFYTRIFAFVYSRVGNVELSKDLCAEVFEKAYVKGHGLRERAAYGTWLFTIAKNVVAGHFRRNRRELNGLDRVKDSLWLTDPPEQPEERTIRGERIYLVMRHLRTLARRDQEILSLKFDAELTNAEIGTVMRMTEVNVRVAVFRALKRLRALIEAERETQ